MLAQNFKTSAELGISDVELESLVKVLGMLERGEIAPENFYMGTFWSQVTTCRTTGCICGWANYVSGGEAFPETKALHSWRIEEALQARLPVGLQRLFGIAPGSGRLAKPHEAAIAVRNYLTFGEPRWAEALA